MNTDPPQKKIPSKRLFSQTKDHVRGILSRKTENCQIITTLLQANTIEKTLAHPPPMLAKTKRGAQICTLPSSGEALPSPHWAGSEEQRATSFLSDYPFFFFGYDLIDFLFHCGKKQFYYLVVNWTENCHLAQTINPYQISSSPSFFTIELQPSNSN